MSTSEDRHPVLYGVVGLERHGTGAGGMGFVGAGRRTRAVVLSESLSFEGQEGGTVTVTSRRPGDDADLERARTWAPTGPYMASPAELSETLDEWHFEKIEASHRSRAPWRLRSELLAQLWFNTLGPGARTWFGNHYTTVRRYTFRLRWRP